ncbi:helix-turn-helix domain-containing protein [Microscilla marina]|uniref:Helix-turn-helix domain protein n=1 Tax=Microscilla marina ATCC 23134 TaxID=313606 RepID=A1ZJY2_MICM2|nr:helix-turn-helix transcriptional regulator [Microscilla marina]EAY29435.1 helix-turn-helix domain protein [Microscilla marina ATCC 23134]
MKIGEKVKKLRELRNYTQEYMAEQLEMSQQNYSLIENDEDEDISLKRLKKIAETLEISLNDLLNFEDKQIFNNYGNYSCAENNQNTINNHYDAEKKLLEQQIESQRSEIEYLRKMLERALGTTPNESNDK